jgi:hypothetical protein
MYVYEYYYVDEYKGLLDPIEVYGNSEDTLKTIEAVKKEFLRNGWEGDGEIKLIWIPSFVDGFHDENYGEFVWFVKQDNNGTSFIGSSHELVFERLRAQNERSSFYGEIKRVIIIDSEINGFRNDLRYFKANLDKISRSTSDIELSQLLIDGLQNRIITKFFEFLGDCYLRYLVHVLSEGNHDNLQLMKTMSINLPLNEMGNEIDSVELDDSQNQWLTISRLIRLIWNNYKFLPAKDQLSEFYKAVTYTFDEANNNTIKQHIFIRNCIQHHSGYCTEDVNKMTGFDRLHIKNSKNSTEREVTIGQQINLTIDELDYFIIALNNLLDSYENHVETRMTSRDIYRIPE